MVAAAAAAAPVTNGCPSPPDEGVEMSVGEADGQQRQEVLQDERHCPVGRLGGGAGPERCLHTPATGRQTRTGYLRWQGVRWAHQPYRHQRHPRLYLGTHTRH